MNSVDDFSYQIIFPAKDQMRARKVVRHSNYGHVYKFASTKCGRMLQLESANEYHRAIQHEYDPSVIIFHEQPFRLELTIDGSVRNQYPDFLVFYDDGSVVVEEVKPANKISKPEVSEKLALQKVICTRLGYGFRVVTDEIINSGHLLANSKLIHGKRQLPVAPFIQEYVNRSLENGPKAARSIIKEGFGATEVMLHALLAHHVLTTDLLQPLGPDSYFQINVRRPILTEKQRLAFERTCI